METCSRTCSSPWAGSRRGSRRRRSGTIDQAVGIGGPVDAAAARDLCRFFEGVDTQQELTERALFHLVPEQRAGVAHAAFAADCPDEAEHLPEVLAIVDR